MSDRRSDRKILRAWRNSLTVEQHRAWKAYCLLLRDNEEYDNLVWLPLHKQLTDRLTDLFGDRVNAAHCMNEVWLEMRDSGKDTA